MYQQEGGSSQMKRFCCVFLLILGPMFVFMGIIFIAILGKISSGSLIAGVVMVIVAGALTIIGIRLCVMMRKESKQNLTQLANNGQPLVSGAAPPGPISGFHVEATRPSAPLPGYQPPPNFNQPPPSYSQVTAPSYSQVTGK